ncbi:hypothetical protein LBMAG42_04730 [Deltaproteobacteria bacterium]|nr:hypothetical protein LBMAG42_04730 [Deltaproteobacteria bacterium]
MWLLVLAACSRGPEDPRPALQAGFVEGRPVRLSPDDALRDGRHFEACIGYKQAARASLDDVPWRGLLMVAARDPGCLAPEAGASLAAWAKGREGWKDAVGEWEAGHDLWVDPATLSPPSRLRVLLRGTDQAAVVAAAEAVLAASPEDPFACAVVIQDAIDRGELAGALSVCASVRSSAVMRLRGRALDEAGRYADAVDAYDAAGFTLHAAAILYQELPERDAEALQRMDEDVPPVALHRGWRAVLRHEPVDVSRLDDSPEATMLRALAGSPTAIAALPDLPGLEPLVLHARLTGDLRRLEAELERAPTSDVLLRANLGIRLERGLDSSPAGSFLGSVNSDHVRLGGVVTRREAPWSAIVPWTWTYIGTRMHLRAVGGASPIGDAWVRAIDLPDEARDAALATLQAAHPELRGLARWRAGGSFLDAPPGCR